MKGKVHKAPPPPRDRIVGTARNLFHELGFRGVGVDTIAEEAGTNKMTLYRHFDSKDDLIVECLRAAAAESMKYLHEIEEKHRSNPAEQLRDWIEFAADAIASDCRGCDLTNASVELTDTDHPARRVIEEVKASHRNWLAGACAKAGIRRSELLADTLATLFEGARVARQTNQSQVVDFRAMASAVVNSFEA